MNVANATRHEVSYRVQHRLPAPSRAEGELRPLPAGDAVAVQESWTVEFFLGKRIVAQYTVFDPASVVRLVERNGVFQVEVSSSRHGVVDMERLIESMLPSSVPGSVAVLQARRNAEAREGLLREFGALTSAEVSDLAGSRASNKAALANRWKQEGRIFPVTHHGQTLFPAFQFDGEGQPRPVIAEVLSTLGKQSRDWELALWFLSARGSLGGKRPADLLESDPGSVAEAARREIDELVF